MSLSLLFLFNLIITFVYSDCNYGQVTTPTPCTCLTQGLWTLRSTSGECGVKTLSVGPNSTHCFGQGNIFYDVQVLGVDPSRLTPQAAEYSRDFRKLLQKYDDQVTSVHYRGHSTIKTSLVIHQGTSWRLTTLSNEKYCVLTDDPEKYCVVDLEYEKRDLNIFKLESGPCDEEFPILRTKNCMAFDPEQTCAEALALRGNLRVKRQDAAPAADAATEAAAEDAATETPAAEGAATEAAPAEGAATEAAAAGAATEAAAGGAATESAAGGAPTEAGAEGAATPAPGAEGATAAALAEGAGTTVATAAGTPDPNAPTPDPNAPTVAPAAAPAGGAAAPPAGGTSAPAAALAAGNDTALVPPPPGTITVDPKEDEDNISAGDEVGPSLMRSQMAQYIESLVSELVGFLGKRKKRSTSEKIQRRYPVIKLLELSKEVMQRTCMPVSRDYFNLATSSFINLQLQNFHLKEPYISYSAFLRIENALKRCVNEAKPHLFYTGNATFLNKTKEYCDNHLPSKSTNQTIFEEEIRNVSIPEYATGFVTPTSINEPLIETVWKIVVNAHSYCYTKFSDYYNDHHTFTVSMLPLFTNAVQELWLPNNGYEIKEGNMIYGGLLGDPRKILTDINNCVGASREDGNAYPWFMNRPPRDWNNEWFPNGRKKRHTTSNCINFNQLQQLQNIC